MRACIGEADHNLVDLGHQVFHLIVEVWEGGADSGHVALKTNDSPDRDAQRARKFHIGSNQLVGGVLAAGIPKVFIVTADDAFILVVYRCLQSELPTGKFSIPRLAAIGRPLWPLNDLLFSQALDIVLAVPQFFE